MYSTCLLVTNADQTHQTLTVSCYWFCSYYGIYELMYNTAAEPVIKATWIKRPLVLSSYLSRSQIQILHTFRPLFKGHLYKQAEILLPIGGCFWQVSLYAGMNAVCSIHSCIMWKRAVKTLLNNVKHTVILYAKKSQEMPNANTFKVLVLF